MYHRDAFIFAGAIADACGQIFERVAGFGKDNDLAPDIVGGIMHHRVFEDMVEFPPFGVLARMAKFVRHSREPVEFGNFRFEFGDGLSGSGPVQQLFLVRLDFFAGGLFEIVVVKNGAEIRFLSRRAGVAPFAVQFFFFQSAF